ncbi:MAG TPA: hypothetical protein VF163_11560, partial [Micromonosporaceae bacterium]
LQWWVLDWNEPALRFYEALGAAPMDEWTVHRVSGPALVALSANAPHHSLAVAAAERSSADLDLGESTSS